MAFVDMESATKYPTDELQLSAGRQADQSFLGACLKEGAYEVFLKSIIVPFYSLYVELSIKRQQERARTIISPPHRPFLKLLLPAKNTEPINDFLILHFFSFNFITEISQ